MTTEDVFLTELRQWLDNVTLPDGLHDWGLTAATTDLTAARAWQRLLHDGGWAGLAWPQEYGGQGAAPSHQAAFAEELAGRGLPRQISLTGPDVAGPLLITHGTAEQQRELLPKILTGEHVWCQLWSEPDAGSDLAGVRTRAILDGACWRVSGQKVWTSAAQYADYALLLARTGNQQPPWAGLTMFVISMDRPGITVSPIVQLDGEAKFNEVQLDDVAVRHAEVLGPVDGGWNVLISSMGRERMTIGAQAVALFRTLDTLIVEVKAEGRENDPILRQRLSACWARTWVLRASFRRLLEMAEGLSDPRFSMLKLAASELLQEIASLAGDIHGPSLVAGEGCVDHAQRLLASVGATIAGGTSEIQRNVLAERVLGLPRDPR